MTNSDISPETYQINKTLFELLKYTKSRKYTEGKHEDLVKSLVDDVLGELYHPQMSLIDVLSIVTKYWEQLCKDERFKVNHSTIHLLKSLVQYDSSNRSMTISEFYKEMIQKMLDDMMLSYVGFCLDLFNNK